MSHTFTATETEEWRPIPGCPGFEASSLGRIRSLDRVRMIPSRWGGMRLQPYHGRILKLRRTKTGEGSRFYLTFISDGGITRRVNRAVCHAFNGPPPSSMHEAAHLVQDVTNNRAENLAWATPKENASHKVSHGTDPIGGRNGAAKLTEPTVIEITRRYASGESSAALAAEFGVSKGAIYNCYSADDWIHVNNPYREAARAQAAANIRAARMNRTDADAMEALRKAIP